MRWTKYVFFLFWAFTLLLYIPSIGAGFVHDFLGWQRAYDEGSFSDIINCFGYPGNHQFLHLIFYSFYKIFHLQGLPWYLLFCTLHAINGYVFYVFIKKLSVFWGGNISPFVAFLGVLVFLTSPYCVEAVVWKTCVHYLLSFMEIMLIFLAYIRYVEKGERKILIGGCFVFFLSLFTLELSLITPLAISFCGLVTFLISGEKKKVLKHSVLFIGILWVLMFLYLVLNKITLGSIVGHYGAKVHLHFDLISIVSNEMKYLVKHIFYARFFSFNIKNILFDQLLSFPEVAFFGLSILLAVFILHFIKVKRLSSEWHIAFLGLFVSILYVLPVSNIYFYHLQFGTNDRLSYIPIAFIILAILAASSNFPLIISYIVLAAMILFNLFFQQKTLKYWHDSTVVLTSLKEHFKWNDASIVFILNSPDNMQGITMASAEDDPSGVKKLLDYQTLQPFQGKMFDIFQYNMTSPEDGVKVEQVGPMQLKVTFDQWGNWWHRNGIGAESYENDYYKAELMDNSYLLTFKQFPEGSVILYQDGSEWKEFMLNKTVQ
ncbi:MAG: hypothetical protein ABJC12_06070 [Saprospiraceae bacterium]